MPKLPRRIERRVIGDGLTTGMLSGGLKRLYNSSVIWSWALNGFRVGSALLLLPLLLTKLPSEEFGMYQVFLGLVALLPVIDFGFSVSIGRYVSYGMAGATDLQAMGHVVTREERGPNYALLWDLLGTTRTLFRYMSLVALLVMGGAGTASVWLRVEETASPTHTWIAWGVALFSGVLEIYAGWWNVFLRGMNQVLLSARIAVCAQAVRLALSVGLLLGGAGLLAVPLAGLVSSFLQRHWSRRSCLKRLEKPSVPPQRRTGSLLRILWPTSWRAGLQFLSGYLATYANNLICMVALGLKITGEYGLSLQIAILINGMSSVWTLVKWPLVGQYRTRGDYAGLRRMLWLRVWLQAMTFIVLALGAWFLGPILLEWLGSGKTLLPPLLFGLLLLNGFLEMHFTFWTTLLSTENRIPSLWPSVVTNVTSMVAVLCLVTQTELGVASLVVAPLCAGSLFNYWFWAFFGARSLRTTFFRFVFGRPDRG